MFDIGGVDNWEWYGESLNPNYSQPYSDYRDAVDEGEHDPDVIHPFHKNNS